MGFIIIKKLPKENKHLLNKEHLEAPQPSLSKRDAAIIVYNVY